MTPAILERLDQYAAAIERRCALRMETQEALEASIAEADRYDELMQHLKSLLTPKTRNAHRIHEHVAEIRLALSRRGDKHWATVEDADGMTVAHGKTAWLRSLLTALEGE